MADPILTNPEAAILLGDNVHIRAAARQFLKDVQGGHDTRGAAAYLAVVLDKGPPVTQPQLAALKVHLSARGKDG